MTRSANDRRQEAADRALWRRGRDADAPADEAGYFLDLAGLAEGRLDPDEHERIAALVAADPAAAADVAAAQAMTGTNPAAPRGVLDRITARAASLAPRPPAPSARILAFRRSTWTRPALPGLVRWASLAAAVALVGWLGFAIGSSTASAALAPPGIDNPDISLNALFDPGTAFLRELGNGLST